MNGKVLAGGKAVETTREETRRYVRRQLVRNIRIKIEEEVWKKSKCAARE